MCVVYKMLGVNGVDGFVISHQGRLGHSTSMTCESFEKMVYFFYKMRGVNGVDGFDYSQSQSESLLS